MKKKKVIALLALAAVVSAAVLTGCAKKKAAESTETSESTESTESEAEPTEQPDTGLFDTERPDTEQESTETESTEGTEEPEKPSLTQEAKDELWALLTSVKEDVQPGTAGSSLKADAVAVKLLQWGVKETMSPGDAKAIAEEFVAAQSDGFYAESIEVVDFACREMQGKDVEQLLEDIGMSLSDKTWGDEPLPLVEAVMEGSGLR
ncbi:MAG: hypothetical protein NC180_07325 [Muribaculaceae bacterium]|nr:hypothetical protein [Roseburia sp.]MCM1429958.1 hypothetical protein [Muribaculaceae bacterium]MCM1493015.1 hypothetical protein [Muribaculaceae bacterium]